MAEKQEEHDDTSLVSNSIVSSLVEIPFYPLSYIKTLTQVLNLKLFNERAC